MAATTEELQQMREHFERLLGEASGRIQNLERELSAEKGKVQVLMASKATTTAAGEKDKDKKGMMERQGFKHVPTYGGRAKEYEDWKFKLINFLSAEKGFVPLITWCEERETMATDADMNVLTANTQDADVRWLNDQLYVVLAAVCVDGPLMQIKNLQEEGLTRGVNSWFKISREFAGKSRARMQRLTRLVNHPVAAKTFQDAQQCLDKWENDLREFGKLGGQVDEFSKIMILSDMVPTELSRDVQAQPSLTTYEAAYKYITDQIPTRKDKAPAKR